MKTATKSKSREETNAASASVGKSKDIEVGPAEPRKLVFPTPAQDSLNAKIDLLKKQINASTILESTSMASTETSERKKELELNLGTCEKK